MATPTETIQSLYAAFGRDDLDGILAMLTEDVEWTHRGSIGLPYMGCFNGKPAVARWFGHVAACDGIQAFEPREFLAGPDHVTVLGWERTQALPDGDVFETDWVHVFGVTDGKVSRFIHLRHRGVRSGAALAATARVVVHGRAFPAAR